MTFKRVSLALISVAICFAMTAQAEGDDKSDAKPDTKPNFDEHILPIFRAKCIRCHAGVEPKAGLNLTRPSSLLTGGDSGAALRIGAAEFSLLYEVVSSDRMPKVGQKLTAEEKGLLRRWINEGAAGVSAAAKLDPAADLAEVEHWSFHPPQQVAPPTPKRTQSLRTPIDAFIQAKLEQAGLEMAPAADRTTLLRRAWYGLLGIPPSPEAVEQFLADDRPDAYERMVDQLLADVRYGERWGRHWLDVAGYTESAGILNEDRPLPLAWRYRDYVIRSFNADKSYSRFLQEQIAGDELTSYWAHFENDDQLPPEVIEGVLATGFLRTAADPSRPDFKTIKNAHSQYYYPTLFDTMQVVGTSTMGLTLQCARCHSHKFDPVPQVDYYRMMSVFMSAYRPDNWVPQMNRRLHIASKKEKEAAAKKNAEIDKNIKQWNAEIAALKKSFAEQLFDKRLAETPADKQAAIRDAFAASEKERTDEQQALVKEFKTSLRPEGKELDKALNAIDEYKTQTAALNTKIAAENGRRWRFDEIRALYDLAGEVQSPVLLRGDPLTPGPQVEPGVLTSLQTEQPFTWTPPGKDAKTSGRRLAFARWLTQPRHPLTARVMVNRIWMHHFGRGVVETPDDFGVAGAPPSHPEMLDWLANEFVASGWSVKHMHRLILHSHAWRQTSRPSPSHSALGIERDPRNRLFWRQSMRRIEAESLRDATLSVAGLLSSRMYGNSHAVARQGDGEVIVNDAAGRDRRSIYIRILRLNPETMLEVFDQPTISINCTQRSTSTVSTQALTLLNSDAMRRVAEAFAKRLLAEDKEDAAERAMLVAFSRPPDAGEREALRQFVKAQTQRRMESMPADKRDPVKAREQALSDLCHMLMSANEFVYID